MHFACLCFSSCMDQSYHKSVNIAVFCGGQKVSIQWPNWVNLGFDNAVSLWLGIMRIYSVLEQEFYNRPSQNHPSFLQPPKPVTEIECQHMLDSWGKGRVLMGLKGKDPSTFVIQHFFPVALLLPLVPQLQICVVLHVPMVSTQHCDDTCQNLRCLQYHEVGYLLILSPTYVLKQYLSGFNIKISLHQSSYRGSRLSLQAQLCSDFLLQGHFLLRLAWHWMVKKWRASHYMTLWVTHTPRKWSCNAVHNIQHVKWNNLYWNTFFFPFFHISTRWSVWKLIQMQLDE